MRARDDLRRHACAADDDPAGETDVDTCRCEVRVRPIDPEGQLTDRVWAVRGRSLKAPRLALDLHDSVIGARDGAVESRAHRPAIDDRSEVEVAIDRDVQEATIDRCGDGPRKAAPDPRENRSCDHVAANTHSQLAIEV